LLEIPGQDKVTEFFLMDPKKKRKLIKNLNFKEGLMNVGLL